MMPIPIETAQVLAMRLAVDSAVVMSFLLIAVCTFCWESRPRTYIRERSHD